MQEITSQNEKKSLDERYDERNLIKKYIARQGICGMFNCCRNTTAEEDKEIMKDVGKDPRNMWTMVSVINKTLLILALIDLSLQILYQVPQIDPKWLDGEGSEGKDQG